jgi:hypothetical protein
MISENVLIVGNGEHDDSGVNRCKHVHGCLDYLMHPSTSFLSKSASLQPAR